MKRILFLLVALFYAAPLFAQLTGADEIGSVVIHKRPLDDDHTMYNGTNFRYYGPTLTSGTAKFFGVKFDYDGSTTREADLRFALYNMNKEIVELYKPMRVNVLAGGVNGYVVPCQVNAPAGDYYVVPLFRWAGESDWTAVWYSIFHPDNDIDGYYQSLWKFTVVEDKLPLVNYVRMPDGMNSLIQGTKFTLSVKLSNHTSSTLKGRIKIMHERNINKYFPGYEYNPEQSTEEFFDCLSSYASLNGVKADEEGAFSISMEGNSSLSLDFQNIVTYENHGVYDQFCGEIVCYFLQEGKSDIPENWVMLQEDCSSLFRDENLIFTEVNDDFWSATTTITSECSNKKIIDLVPNPTAVPTISVSDVAVSYEKASGLLHFSNIPEPCKLVVTSMSGSVIIDRIVNDNSNISLERVPSGVYVAIIIKDGKGICSHKFVK